VAVAGGPRHDIAWDNQILDATGIDWAPF
jgi:hypothetical protein